MIKKILFLIPLLLLASGHARAACSYTTVSGTITDPNGVPYAFANVSADLVPSTSGNPVCSGQAFSGHIPAQTDGAGTFTMQVPPNASIVPASTQWKFTVGITPGVAPPFGKGPQAFTATVTISGATQSLTSTLSTAAPALTVTFTSSGSSAFSALTSGTNTTAAMVVGTGASLAVSGSGTIAATTAAALAALPTPCSAGNAPTGILANGNSTGCQAVGGSGAFSALTSGTNTTAAMLVGTGASLAASGSGTLTATAAPLAGISGLGTGMATFLATPSSANLAATVTDETGTGALVFGTAPTITLANGSGLPISTGVSGLGTGVAAFLATPSSANLATAVTGATGTGALMFGTNPTIAGATITAAFTGTGAYVPVSLLNSGTAATSSTFWRGDGVWAAPAGGISGLTTGFLPKAGSATTIANSLCDEGITTANTLTCTDTAGITAPLFHSNGAGAGGLVMTAGTAQGHATASTVTLEAAATTTAYEVTLPIAAATGIPLWTNSSNVVAQTIAATVPVAQGGTNLASGTSGGILGYTATGTLASSVALTSNVLVKGGGAGATPTNSLFTDNATTVTYTGTGGISAPKFTSSVATGTAPFVVTSTTTVPNLTLSNHPQEYFCGTTSTCSATAELSPKIVFGSAPLVTGTPSTVTISGISPAFTATADYQCTVTGPGSSAATNLYGWAAVSASSFTITGPATVTTVVSYVCIGF